MKSGEKAGEVIILTVLEMLESSGSKLLQTKSMVNRFKNEKLAKGLLLYRESQ